MKCPRCGNEMILDTHRKYPLHMCYDCGYIEGRNVEKDHEPVPTNFGHMKTLNLNELAAFLAVGLGLDEERLAEWLGDTTEK